MTHSIFEVLTQVILPLHHKVIEVSWCQDGKWSFLGFGAI